jgi:hypothetical protein
MSRIARRSALTLRPAGRTCNPGFVMAGVARRSENFNLDSTQDERYPSCGSYQGALATTRNPARIALSPLVG